MIQRIPLVMVKAVLKARGDYYKTLNMYFKAKSNIIRGYN